MFCFAVRQSPIKVCNLISCDGRVMSIGFRIEAQLNKKVSQITTRKANVLFLWVQRDPPKQDTCNNTFISLLEATVILNMRTATVLQFLIQLRKILVGFGNKISLGETFFCTFKNRVGDGKRNVTASYCVSRASRSRLQTTLRKLNDACCAGYG